MRLYSIVCAISHCVWTFKMFSMFFISVNTLMNTFCIYVWEVDEGTDK